MKLSDRMHRRPGTRQAPAGPEHIRLVVMEDGASALEPSLLPKGEEDTLMLVQDDLEDGAQPALRVLARLATIEQSGRAIGWAALSMVPRRDPQLAPTRALIARALLSHMVARGSGELLLIAENAPPELRDDLIDLVDELLGEHERCEVVIRAIFRCAAPQHSPSGVYPKSAAQSKVA